MCDLNSDDWRKLIFEFLEWEFTPSRDGVGVWAKWCGWVPWWYVYQGVRKHLYARTPEEFREEFAAEHALRRAATLCQCGFEFDDWRTCLAGNEWTCLRADHGGLADLLKGKDP